MTLGYSSLGPESGFPVTIDPVVEAVFETAKTYQTELNYTPSPSKSRLDEIVEDLDSQWPHYGEFIGVSGLVRSAIIDQDRESETQATGPFAVEEADDQVGDLVAIADDKGNPILKKYYVNDQGFQSQGFTVVYRPWPETVGGHEIGHQAVIKLLLYRTVEVHFGDISKVCQLQSTARINEVSLELPTMSSEYAEMLSRENFSSSLQEADKRLADKQTIASKIMALRTLKIPSTVHTTFEEVAALEQYFSELLGVSDERLPFVADLRKGTILFNTGNHAQQAETLEVIDQADQLGLEMTGITLYPVARPRKRGNHTRTTYDGTQFELRLIVRIIGREVGEDSEELEIRLRDIKDIKNFRDTLYHGQ